MYLYPVSSKSTLPLMESRRATPVLSKSNTWEQKVAKSAARIQQYSWPHESQAGMLSEAVAVDTESGLTWSWPVNFNVSEEPGENYTLVASVFVYGKADLSQFDGQLRDLRDVALRIENSINVLVNTPHSFVVPISTMSPEPYKLDHTLFAVVEPVVPDDPEEDCEFVASFPEASVAASGDTIEEAVRLLKERLIERMQFLEEHPSLGDRLHRQLAVLRDVIRKCPEEATTK
jgi:predicted RNase H-like HicB family nuclease